MRLLNENGILESGTSSIKAVSSVQNLIYLIDSE